MTLPCQSTFTKYLPLGIIIAIIALSCHASAQTLKFAVLDGKSKPGEPIKEVCSKQVSEIKKLFVSVPHPGEWTIVVACTDQVWDQLRQRASMFDTDWGFTEVTEKKTFFRGTAFTSRHDLLREFTPDFAVAHEIAHILLNGGTEDQANHKARELLSFHSASLAEVSRPQ